MGPRPHFYAYFKSHWLRPTTIFNVRWSKSNGRHGDRFTIEFKTENLVWKTSSSKQLSLQEKLNSAKQKLQELYSQYPYLNPENNSTVNQAAELSASFQKSIELSN